jgi:trans-2,3-dihydro-3-hydroxyanthranilate isomerase
VASGGAAGSIGQSWPESLLCGWVIGLRYDVVDVFTDRPFAGNPLAVIHGAAELSTAAMQAVAVEFGLSETAFVLPPTVPAADYRLRIFTPRTELSFAGHPSVGSAWVIAQAGLIAAGSVVQECAAGLIGVQVDEAGAQVEGGVPVVGPRLDGAALAAAVGLVPGELDPELAAGVAAAGAPFAFLPVFAPAVARAVPDPVRMRAVVPHPLGLTIVAFDAGAGRAHVRMFRPGSRAGEDPATGSAAVALAVFLVDRGALAGDGQSTFVVRQGAEVGRPSQLDVAVAAEKGVATRTSVRGGVVAVARGELLALPIPGRR